MYSRSYRSAAHTFSGFAAMSGAGALTAEDALFLVGTELAYWPEERMDEVQPAANTDAPLRHGLWARVLRALKRWAEPSGESMTDAIATYGLH